MAVTEREKNDLVMDLYRRYGVGAGGRPLSTRRLRVERKRLAWRLVTRGAHWFKRMVDIAVSLAMGLMLAPMLILVALLIKMHDGGPVLFWQTRVGRFGREFPFPKFRSMVLDAERLKKDLLKKNDHKDSITFKMKKDPRVTWIGRIIRKLSIDELPQLWCVLVGDMTLVGPRPPVPSEVAKYSLEQRRRLDATPGLTCLWQVSGRGDVPFAKQLKMDVEYIDRRSLWMDFKILLKTIPAVLSGRGAY